MSKLFDVMEHPTDITGVASRFEPLVGVSFYVDKETPSGVLRKPVHFRELGWLVCASLDREDTVVVFHEVKSPMHVLGCSLGEGLKGRVDADTGDYLVVDLMDQTLYAMSSDTFHENFY